LQTVVQHVGIALISFSPDGKIGLINTAAKKLLGLRYLRNVRDLEIVDEKFARQVIKLQPGEKALYRVDVNGEMLQLAVYATHFQLQEKRYILVSMQNIGQELEETELESWQKLIRVLTHEIMNSVTPISSLASTVNRMLSEDGMTYYRKHEEIEAVEDIRDAVETIEKRSNGLLNFVDTYRNLTRLPKPNFQIFSLSRIFKQIQQLMQPKVTEKKINFTTSVEPQSLELTADSEMLEQVLINLLINAIQAVENVLNAQIELKSWMNKQGRIVIEVSDNGPGIPEEVQDKIFIPFFTTKKDGSGIGLSLTRQIMRLHRGTISVNSKPNERTVFTLKF
jgi:signal transduction histidine kinase